MRTVNLLQILKNYDFPKQFYPLNIMRFPDYERRLDLKTNEFTDDLYFTLKDEKTQLNIRIRDNKIIEFYPLASKEILNEYNINEFENHPYISVDMETGEQTHLYYCPKNSTGTVINRIDKKGNFRYYKVFLIPTDNISSNIFEKYHPNYIIIYYDNDSATSALLGYNFINKYYDKTLVEKLT